MRNGMYIIFAGLALGIIWQSLFFSKEIILYCLVFSLFISAIWFLFPKKYLVVFLLFITPFIFGMLRSEMTQQFSGNHELDGLLGKKVLIDGSTVVEPDKRDAEVLLTVQVQKINEKIPDSRIKVIIFASLGPSYAYGQHVVVSGKLKPIKNFQTDTGTEFDYIHYLAKDGIYYSLSTPDIQILSGDVGNPVLRFLFQIKQSFMEKIEKVIPYPASALLGGLLLGAKRSLSQATLDAFTKTGVIHMVVISGYNITIVGNVIASCLSFLPRTTALSGSIFGIIFFICMTGFSGASIRAGLMALTAIAAKFLGRNYDPVRALFLSGFLMIAHNPDTLLHDPSFQLSFVGTLGIMVVPTYIEQFFSFITERFGLREMIVGSVASQISLLPLILYMTGNLSLVALPTNMLVLFPVPVTMLFGFLAGAAGFIHFYLSIPFAFLSFMLLTYELNVTSWFAKVPFASVQVPFNLFEMIFVYLLYAGVILFIEMRKKK